ncbi:hypothetical protein [Paraburkholderia sp.]|uniref:hypothetical protein n=1 Tax=Paraburkholderia sp. TaxID=1926495 RepID=UPI002383EB00|nr:hypothetical protein [Paraburkholderia sp.]MDE1179948.1 hypothetical protein [Paraburkholderia sp.]
MAEHNTLSGTNRWLMDLVKAGEAAIAASEDCAAHTDPASDISMLLNSQRELVRGDVTRVRAKLAALTPVTQAERQFAVTFDRRFWKTGTFVYPMSVFLDPAHQFSAQQVQQVQTLNIGESVDLGDGRTVMRQQ